MKFFVVPDSSERWQTVMSLSGRLVLRADLGDRGVVPLLDLAEEDVGDRRAVELEALVDPVDVVGDGHRAEHGRDVDGVALLLGGVLLLGLHRRVGGAEVDGARRELGDAAARADRLVVDRGARRVLEARGPLGVDRRGKVAPAPLMVPPCLAPPSSSCCSTRRPTGSRRCCRTRRGRARARRPTAAASHWLDLTSEHLIGFVALVEPAGFQRTAGSLLPTGGWDVKSV